MSVDSATGTVVADYAYGPFGELLRATGPLVEKNPFRFSTKYRDDETDLVYYGRRYYSATSGRWLSRDPVGERSDANLFAAVRNNPISRIDILGLASSSPGSAAEAKALCDQCRKISSTEPPDGDPLPDVICDRVKPFLRDPQIAPLVKQFGNPTPSGWARKSCPFPNIVCVV